MTYLDKEKNFVYDGFLKLFDYVKKNNYEGMDPFDGLNSKLFKSTFLYKSRFFRLALIQFCKLCPINFRKLLLVPEGFNAKAGALFLLGNLKMFKATGDEKYKKEAQNLYKKLKEVSIKRGDETWEGLGWGYNFDWQARAFYVPVGTPNIVTSVYVGKALIKYYKLFNDEEALELAKQITEFILNEMILTENENFLCFRYIPNEDAQVHNANLLAASFLASISKYINFGSRLGLLTQQHENSDILNIILYNSEELRGKIQKSLNFSIADINEDGSWAYGTKPFHRWVDNFHTAFNIESLIDIQNIVNIPSLNKTIEKVMQYYLTNLFTEKGLPKYYNNKVYPIDIHVIAEVIIVLNKIKSSKIIYDEKRLNCIEEEILKCLKLFQDKKGYFYFQKNNYFGKYFGEHFLNKIPYIRWGEAWIFFALSTIILADN